jgi:AmmeMemoRadiSam system protein A
VVGYAAFVLYADESKAQVTQSEQTTRNSEVGIDLGLSKAERIRLLDIAKQAIRHAVLKEPLPSLQSDSGKLLEAYGAFVTINKLGDLRGCIGHIIGNQPLNSTVMMMAQAAAIEDPRFRPVDKSELKDLQIEISVLTPLKEISDINQIQIGKHGLYITKGYNSGILLPQVATDNGWDVQTFLSQTCHKAGLPFNCWQQPDCQIFYYTADVFNEETIK